MSGGGAIDQIDGGQPPSGADPIRLADFEALALAKLPAGSAAYYSGAANDEVTLARQHGRVRPLAVRAAHRRGDRGPRRLGRGARAPLAVAVHGGADGPAQAGRPRRRSCGGPCVRRARPGVLPLHGGLCDDRGGRRDGRRLLVPAVLPRRRGPEPRAARARRGGGLRGDRAHDGRADPRPARARHPDRVRPAPGSGATRTSAAGRSSAGTPTATTSSSSRTPGTTWRGS